MFSKDLFREMELLRREIDDVFRGSAGRRMFDSVFMPGIGQRGYPLINLHNDEDNLYVETLLPGVDPSELEMTVQQNTLTISGERHKAETPEKVVWHRRERGAGKFLRTVELPLDVKTDEVRAEYKDGLLRVTLPKAEAAKPTRVAIEAS
ncbi:hypothetical protein A7E78_11675 [Syntrophotalea acetylenivorans]|uniref:SHSP domain-containing protein n=1 Tax=Syntrophotalea acetylenivorans TaxID=1842532 RepID=A0A1L3GR78_9BACT|nr:Hsp20/alpha crystallin family protein [Syntrophotalea acetylenivorans]APG28449.1 hypothetical protein A7E78_11675 [Syntrophotalea acetylenivorans]